MMYFDFSISPIDCYISRLSLLSVGTESPKNTLSLWVTGFNDLFNVIFKIRGKCSTSSSRMASSAGSWVDANICGSLRL